MNDYDFYMAGENPMVLPEYDWNYDEDYERERYAYLEDVAWEDYKDESLGL